jgi:hypothetical protein
MKRILIISLAAAGLLFAVSCGETGTKPVKPETNNTAVQQPAKDKMNDTAFENVMNVLKESLDNEKKTGADTASKLQAAEAYILLIKFIHTDREKVMKTGMSDDEIQFLVKDASEKADSRLKDITGSQTAPASVKDEAQAKLKELGSL